MLKTAALAVTLSILSTVALASSQPALDRLSGNFLSGRVVKSEQISILLSKNSRTEDIKLKLSRDVFGHSVQLDCMIQAEIDRDAKSVEGMIDVRESDKQFEAGLTAIGYNNGQVVLHDRGLTNFSPLFGSLRKAAESLALNDSFTVHLRTDEAGVARLLGALGAGDLGRGAQVLSGLERTCAGTSALYLE